MGFDDSPIIINEEALTEAFVPTRLFHREGQIRELERCLKPALKNRSIENIFLMARALSPVVDRAYRNYVRRMVNLGLIKCEGKGRWKCYKIIG